MRTLLPENKIHSEAQKSMTTFHSDVVLAVQKAISENEWVIVGMAGNPFVRKAKAHLTNQGVAFSYIEYGSYFSQWKERLALKLWSGWPTFPQVFHQGIFIGGFDELKKYRS